VNGTGVNPLFVATDSGHPAGAVVAGIEPRWYAARRSRSRQCRQLSFAQNAEHLFMANDDDMSVVVLAVNTEDTSPLIMSRTGLDGGSVSPDGRWAAGSSRNAAGMRIWDNTGRQIHDLILNEHDTVCTFSPDGKRFVGGGSQEYFIWQVGSWRLSHRWKMPTAAATVRHAVFSSDGRWLAISRDGRHIHVFDAELGIEVAQLPGGHYATWLRFSPNGDQMACMDSRMRIRVWNLRTLQSRLFELGLDPRTASPPSVASR
jgi:WD40 repeat protein